MNKILQLLFLTIITVVSGAEKDFTTVRFEKTKSKLTERSLKKIDLFISKIDTSSLQKNGKKLIITGYIDFTPSEIAIDSLALKRAIAVKEYLVEKKLLSKESIIAASVDNEYHILPVTVEGRRLNRRAEIFIGKVKTKKRSKVVTPKKLSYSFIDTTAVKYKTTNKSKDNQLYAGDSILVDSAGFCRINFANSYIVDITSNSFVTLSKNGLKLHNGVVNIQKIGTGNLAPFVIKSRNSVVSLNGNGVIDQRDSSKLLFSNFSKEAKVISPFGTEVAKNMQGVAVGNKQKKIVLVDLPKRTNIIAVEDTILRIPGIATNFNWEKTGKRYHLLLRELSSESVNSIDTTVSDLDFPQILNDGKWQLQIQTGDKYGFRSLWSDPVTTVIKKKSGIIFIRDFIDTTFASSLTRPYSLEGQIDTNVTLFLDSTEISSDSLGIFSREMMLNDDLNPLSFRVIYPDSTVDSIRLQLLYTGADERIFMNDSIMGIEAFTVSREFILKGCIPNATKLSIDGEEIELGKSGAFSKDFKFTHFGKYPVELDISYKNGHSKTELLELERKRYATALDEPTPQILMAGFIICASIFLGVFAITQAIE
jgi:hypothetical protein